MTVHQLVCAQSYIARWVCGAVGWSIWWLCWPLYVMMDIIKGTFEKSVHNRQSIDAVIFVIVFISRFLCPANRPSGQIEIPTASSVVGRAAYDPMDDAVGILIEFPWPLEIAQVKILLPELPLFGKGGWIGQISMGSSLEWQNFNGRLFRIGGGRPDTEITFSFLHLMWLISTPRHQLKITGYTFGNKFAANMFQI